MKIKDSWWKLFGYFFNSLSFSFVNIFLIIISVLTSGATIAILLLSSSSATSFLISFQYFVIIFYGIILFIFVLMNSIKIFGTMYNDGTFLLLMSKPYSRKTIILTQYLSLCLTEFLFIFINVFLIFIISMGIAIFIKINYLIFLVIMIGKLFIFTLAFSFLLTNGIIFLLSFNKIQNVFLIFIIFCSLFLLGGLPYNLIKNINDNITLTFSDGSKFSEKIVKDTLLFQKNLNKGLIKYPDITKRIFNFYNAMSLQELNNINSVKEMNKRITFYNNLGLMETKLNNKIKTASGHVTSWKADYGQPDYTNKDIVIHITFNSYIISFNELELKIVKDNYFQDLFNIINDYNNQFKDKDETSGMNYFMEYQKNLAPSLLTYNLDINKTYITTTDNPTKNDLVTDEILNSLFLGSINYNISGNLQISYDQIFDNPVYFALRSIEDNIYHQVQNYKIITTNKLVIDKNFTKIYNNQNFYTILNYVNVIEQWNQLWTSFMGSYSNYWFNPLASSAIDFSSQNNILFSYADINIKLDNSQKIDSNLSYFQNNKLVILFYLVISITLLFLALIFFNLKTIV